MTKHRDDKIIASWHKNARPWIRAIENDEIQSRIDSTNQAIVDTILNINPKSVLDIGCGEGWLVRKLSRAGIDCLGIDVVATLIDQANRYDLGRFIEVAYEDLSHDFLNEHFDLAVANFSLLGKDSVEHIFKTIPTLLHPNGHFVIQTLHPIMVCGEKEYKDGWREGTWDGFSEQFTDPPPWYFRTIESWGMLFEQNGFTHIKKLEPVNPQTGTITSLLIIGQKRT